MHERVNAFNLVVVRILYCESDLAGKIPFSDMLQDRRKQFLD